MCYCDGNSGSMANSNSKSKQMVETLTAKFASLKAEKSQMDQELKGHQDSRAAAKQDLSKAENIRNKEHEDFVATSTDQEQNINAMQRAIAALEKGMGSFLQMPAAQARSAGMRSPSHALLGLESEAAWSELVRTSMAAVISRSAGVPRVQCRRGIQHRR